MNEELVSHSECGPTQVKATYERIPVPLFVSGGMGGGELRERVHSVNVGGRVPRLYSLGRVLLSQCASGDCVY